VVFFVLIARELGEAAFGDFSFALALTSSLLLAAGLGTEELTTREISRDRSTVHVYITNAVLIKVGMSLLLLALAVGITVAGAYPAEVKLAVALVGAGVAFENTGRSYWSVFQAFERQELLSLSLIVQRFSTLAIAAAALAAGGDLVAVSGAFLAGAVLNLVTVRWALRRHVLTLHFTPDRSRWWPIVREGLPIGAVVVLGALLLRVDQTLISFFYPGTSNAEVGYFAAAFRLVEATLFVGWGLNAAALPWLSRQAGAGITNAYELGMKALAGLLIPITVIFVTLADPLIELLYGSAYQPAADCLRYLGLAVVMLSLSYFAATILVARDRPASFARAQLVVLAVNVAANAVVIPDHGAAGAAAVALGSAVSLAILGALAVRRRIGRASLLRPFAGPLVAAAAMATVIELSELPLVPAAVVGLVVYLGVGLLFERTVFPRDLALLVGLVRHRSSAAPSS
jgi:O-antigen/teichoic acid export membrane protein